MRNRWLHWTTIAVALVLLDGSVTFHNLWPTPAVRWQGELSVELAVLALALAVAGRRGKPLSRGLLRGLSMLWILLVVGRYAEVTAPALYGRDINLYWDLRFVPEVVALLAGAAPPWLVVAASFVTLLLLFVLYVIFRWALSHISAVSMRPAERYALVLMGTAAIALSVGERLGLHIPGMPGFATPVTRTYVRQVGLVREALTASKSLPASPTMNSDLSRVQGADVFLVFLESYGAASYERPELAAGLASSRRQFEAEIHSTNRDVVSAYVESPTFGGSSWLAHISLMSGIEVRKPDTNALLMTQKRETLVTTFGRHGYRTVALMPGLWQSWPEGAFYGFDEIYGTVRLNYRGPGFGWFNIPDQFAIAQLDAIEKSRLPRAPLFVFFPTISTHTPFRPTPPYQSDWQRMLTEEPYETADLDRAFAREPDWMDLGPSYVDAISYSYSMLGGYLPRASRDFVMIVIGDHQPPAVVSGEGAPWDVPAHVITSRRGVLEQLRIHGFQTGLTPHRPVVGRMHELLTVLLDAFGDREPPAVMAAGS
jgi:hypothetical protein